MALADQLEVHSFPRTIRLTRGSEFRQVFEQGKRLYSASFNLKVTPNQCGNARLGMAIAKKTLRRAHERNRIRRLVRESFRTHHVDLPAVDIVLMCRQDVLTLSNADLFQQLEGLWLRLHKLYSAGFRQAE